ncbi:MAG: 50S ribosomal protein L18 [Hyphomonadaceae bacterium]|nr:50S ribosomal protein L18 [Hyphomonadaceae bacterium]
MSSNSRQKMKNRAARVRRRLRKNNVGRPRLSVFRSSKNISVQIIDDLNGVTLASASTLEKKSGVKKGSDTEAAVTIGKLIAERAKKAGIEEVVFDRGAYLFHGRVKALAESAREAGLKF